MNARVAYTYSDFTYDAYLAGTVELDSLGNIVTAERDFSGNMAPSAPTHYGAGSLSYSHQISGNVTGFVRGSYHFATGMYVDDANSEKTDGWELLNTTLGVDLVFGKVNVLASVGMNNVFDQTYAAFVNTNSASREFYEAGEPQNYFATLNLGYTF